MVVGIPRDEPSQWMSNRKQVMRKDIGYLLNRVGSWKGLLLRVGLKVNVGSVNVSHCQFGELSGILLLKTNSPNVSIPSSLADHFHLRLDPFASRLSNMDVYNTLDIVVMTKLLACGCVAADACKVITGRLILLLVVAIASLTQNWMKR